MCSAGSFSIRIMLDWQPWVFKVECYLGGDWVIGSMLSKILCHSYPYRRVKRVNCLYIRHIRDVWGIGGVNVCLVGASAEILGAVS